MQFCSAHFDQNKVLITSFSRILIMQGDSKMLVQNSKLSLWHQNKENSSYKHTCNGNECVWMYFKVYIETYQCNILLNTDITFYNTHPQSNNCPVLIVYQATIHKKCSNYPPPQSMHTGTSDRGLSHTFIGPGAAANGLRGLKTRWWSVCSFSISSEYTKALSVPQIKNPKNWVRRTCGLHLKYSLPTCIFHSFVWGTHSSYLSKYFMYTLYILLSFQALPFTPTQNSKPN